MNRDYTFFWYFCSKFQRIEPDHTYQGSDKSYRSRTVVNHVSVNVKQGEIVGLLDPMVPEKPPLSIWWSDLSNQMKDKVFLDDKEITNLPMYKRAQLGIGYLPRKPLYSVNCQWKIISRPYWK